MKTKIYTIALFISILSLTVFTSCSRSDFDQPGPTGPSTLAVLLNLSASPNVLYAGPTRETTTITATLTKFDGVPLANKTIHFEIVDSAGTRAYVGFLDNQQTVLTKTTDSSGNISFTYSGPTEQELIDLDLGSLDDFKIYIYAYLAWEGKDLIGEQTPIMILKDIYTKPDIGFELQAFPNVLWCTLERPESEIRGIFTMNGIPLTGKKVFFKILSGPGEFSDGFTKTYAITDSNGIATVTYIGPTKDELTFDTFVTIQGHPETDWLHVEPPAGYDPEEGEDYFWIYKQMDIRLIKGHN